MNEATAGLVRQLRQAIERRAEGYPMQITFEPFQLEQLGEILDLAEQRSEESDLWRRVEALAKKVMRERGQAEFFKLAEDMGEPPHGLLAGQGAPAKHVPECTCFTCSQTTAR